PPLLGVHLVGGAQDTRLEPTGPGHPLEGYDVLREARTAPPDPGAEEMRADPVIQADPLGDLVDVAPEFLSDSRDLVDERHPYGQERIGRVLDQLGRGRRSDNE